MRFSLAFLGALLPALLPALGLGGENAGRAIMEKHLAAIPGDEQVTVRMDIYRRVGVAKVDLERPRLSVLFRRGRRGRGAAARTRIDVTSPQDMVGIAMTIRWDAAKKKYEVLRFLPARSALRQVTYLRTDFLQSNLIYEHIVPLVPGNHEFTAKGEKKVNGVDCHVVEATAAKRAAYRSAAYSKVVFYIRKSDSRAARVEYYERGFREQQLVLTRTVESAGREVWLRNQTGERTVLTFSDRKAEPPEEDRFRPATLKSNPGHMQLLKARARLLSEEQTLKRELEALRAEIEKAKAAGK